MLFRTHIVFSFLIGILFIHILNTENQILFMILVLFGSMLPDIDSLNSKISNKIPILPKILSLFVKHRGIFHSIFMAVIISYALYFFTGYFSGFLIGYLSHLIADAMTLSGIAFLYPFSKKRIRGFIKTGSISENLMFLGFLAGIVYILIYIL